jgi:hypothetical protein
MCKKQTDKGVNPSPCSLLFEQVDLLGALLALLDKSIGVKLRIGFHRSCKIAWDYSVEALTSLLFAFV